MRKGLLIFMMLILSLTSFSQVLNNLIPSNTATHTAVQTGDWFNPTTWDVGTVPGDAAIVFIPANYTVNYVGQSSSHIFAIRVDGVFNCTQPTAGVTTTLTFDTFVSTMMSFVKFTANTSTDGDIDVTITPFDIESHKNGTSGYSQVWNTAAQNHFSDGANHYEVTYNTASKYRYKSHALAIADNSANATAVTENSRTLIDDGAGILGRTAWDSTQLSIGFITMGQVEILGKEKLNMAKLSADADKDQSIIELAEVPTGWEVGDDIIVTRGGNKNATNNGEDQKVIQSIVGTTITTTSTLNKNHKGRAADDLHCYVGNLTRNITFKSGDVSDVYHRAHSMHMMNPTNVQITNAAFIDMGRTDKSRLTDDFTWDSWNETDIFRSFSSPLGQEVAILKLMPAQDITNIRGRYSIHLHRLGVAYETDTAYVTGNVVWGNPGWGITHHHSTAVISENVIYDVVGAGLVTESGGEMGLWDDNLVVNIQQGHTTSPYVSAIYFDDILFSGQGLGMKGRGVICRGNVIANAKQGVGVMNMNPCLTNLDRADPLAIANRPGYEVENFPLDVNGYSSERNGVMPVEVALIMENTTVIGTNLGLKSIEREMGVNHESRSIFDGFICWGINQGLSITYQADYSFKDVFISGKNDTGLGIYLWKHSHNHYFENIKLVDLEYGMTVSKLVENTNQSIKIRNNGFTPWYFINLETESGGKLYKIELEDNSSTTSYLDHGDNPIHLASSDLSDRSTTFTILDSTELYVDYATSDFKFEVDGIITDQSGSYNMGVRQSLAQGTLREGYPARIYEFASQAKFEEYLTEYGVYKDENDNNQAYFILNEELPDRRSYDYTTFKVRVKILNAPTTGVFTNLLVEPAADLLPQNQIISRTATVSQSSTNNTIIMYGGAIDVAATKAVDGNNNGRKNVNQYQDGLLPIGTWSETNTELEPWYDLDFGELKTIDYIEIWNIVDTNGFELETMGVNFKDFHVMVADEPFTSATTLAQSMAIADHFYIKDANPHRKFTLNDLNVDGRYVRIQAIGTTKLEFAEVEVVGKTATPCLETFATDVQTACDSYVWIDGNTYTSSNNSAQFTLQNVNGCDSIITLDLTITDLITTTTVNEFNITANQSGASYQWIDCDTDLPITGETNATYPATYNGNFACVLMDNNCTDTTDCVQISGLGVDENDNFDLSIYPNPNSGKFTISTPKSGLYMSIYSIEGKTILNSTQLTKPSHEIDISAIESGVYFVVVQSNDIIKTYRVVIQY
jgi:hypothetical protein